MNLSGAAATLRDCVNGCEVVDKATDVKRMVKMPGLLQLVQARLQGDEREIALLALGKILGVADAVAGVKFQE